MDYENVSFKVAKMLVKRGFYETLTIEPKEFYDKTGKITTIKTPWPLVSWTSVECWLEWKHNIYAVVIRNDQLGPFWCNVYRPADPYGHYPEGKQPMKRVGRVQTATTYEEGWCMTLERAVKSVPKLKPQAAKIDDDFPF